MQLKIIFEPSEDGGYTVYVPALPGCVSEGDTLAEARVNVREAIEVYLEDGCDAVAPAGAIVEQVVV